jgi:hypothetical protein
MTATHTTEATALRRVEILVQVTYALDHLRNAHAWASIGGATEADREHSDAMCMTDVAANLAGVTAHQARADLLAATEPWDRQPAVSLADVAEAAEALVLAWVPR